MRETPPRTRPRAPHALWHISEDASIARFAPSHRPGHALDEPLVWAIDTRHLPLRNAMVASSLDYSGIRLRNAVRP